jgi:hypothetical protein
VTDENQCPVLLAVLAGIIQKFERDVPTLMWQAGVDQIEVASCYISVMELQRIAEVK